MSLKEISKIVASHEDGSVGVEFPKISHSTGEGDRYEERVQALVFLRCVRRGLRFQLSSNNGDAGKFDDLVLVWRPQGSPEPCTLLVQMKHKTSQNSMTVHKGTLFPSGGNKDFNINKYYKSYREIKNALEGSRQVLVLSTNAHLADSAKDLLTKQSVDAVPGADLLHAGGCLYRLNPNNEDVKERLQGDPDFIENFFMFCDQRNSDEITRDICAEIEQLLGPVNNRENICELLCKSVREWMNKYSRSFNGDWDRWRGIVEKHIRTSVTDCNRLTTSLQYNNVELLRQHIESVNPAWVRPPSEFTLPLSVSKVHQVIRGEAHIIVNVQRLSQMQDQVLRPWGRFCRWLVLVDDKKEEAVGNCLQSELLRQVGPNRRLIIVSFRGQESFQDTYKSCDIRDECWEKLLLTKVRFNGDDREYVLADLVPCIGTLKDLLEDKAQDLLALEQQSDLSLGRVLDPVPLFYIRRQLEMRQCVSEDFFYSLDQKDVCIMDEASYSLRQIRYAKFTTCNFETLKTLLTSSNNEWPVLVVMSNINIPAIEELCSNFQRINVYTVKVTVHGWNLIHFRGEIGKIRKHIKEQRMQLSEGLDIFNNKVVIEGKPGVGKSTVLLDVAKKIRNKNARSWIVRLNLNDYCNVFAAHARGSDIAVEIVRRVVSSKDELGDLECTLLHHCLLEYRHIVCLVDGFDEVCPNYSEKCVQTLKQLAPRQGKMVVTTRPAFVELLEAGLATLSHSLPAFNDAQLMKFFEHYKPKKARITLSNLTKTFRDLLRTPLFAKMYTDILRDGQRSYDIVALYDAFFQMKLRRLYVEKFGANFCIPGMEHIYEEYQKRHELQLSNLAVYHLCRNKEIINQLQLPLVNDDTFIKVGIVYQLYKEKNMFVHKTFAEYFLAKWCFSGVDQKLCAEIYGEGHSNRNLEFFLEIFDRFASRGRRLLIAVLDGKQNEIEALMKQDMDPEEADIWERTALHMAAAYGMKSTLLNLLCERSGLSALHAEDSLLHWTPLRYAAERRRWSTMKTLLNKGASLSQLGEFQDALRLLLAKSGLGVETTVLKLLTEIAEEESPLEVLQLLWGHMDQRGRRHSAHHCLPGTVRPRNLNLHRCSIALNYAKCPHTIDSIKLLIDSGADLNYQDSNGRAALHDVVHSGNTACLQLLINAGAHVHIQDKEGRTALHYAALTGSKDGVQLLIETGADINCQDNYGMTALHDTVYRRNTDCMKLLIDAGAHVDIQDDEGSTTLHCAAHLGSIDSINLLINCGVDINCQDRDGLTALHAVIRGGKTNCIKLLIDAGAHVDVQDKEGRTALHYAVRSGSIDIVKMLMDCGADINCLDNYGMTAVHDAVFTDNTGCIKLLIDAGAHLQIQDKAGRTALDYAGYRGSTNTANLLISSGADINWQGSNGKTALFAFVCGANTNCIKLLIDAGAHVDVQDEEGKTALHSAVLTRSKDVVQLLIENGADINCQDTKGRTALHVAARSGNTECIKPLLEAGAYVHFQDEDGKTPLHYAACTGSEGSVKLLINSGADVNCQDSKCCTALHYAAHSSHTCCVKLLTTGNANVQLKDMFQKTALHNASIAGNVDCIRLLIDAGSEILAKDQYMKTAVHYAVKARSSHGVKLLLQSITSNVSSDLI